MSRLLRAEALKVLTVRTLLWLALGELAVVVVALVARAATFNGTHDAAADRVTAQHAASSILFALLAGVLIMASESTHGTITQTFLVAPVRERVVTAKVVVAAGAGAALAVLAEAVTIVIGVLGGILVVGNAALVFAGTIVGASLAAALGTGLGAIFRGQGSAIAVALVWLLIGESLVAAAVGHGVRFFPGHVFAATARGVRAGTGDVLGTWTGAVVAALYAAAFLAAGTALLSRRDV
jgi:ABC-type transport system involved in multi-copper enzyme maturation permease subunit